jgi:hypothetical protein
MIHSRKMAHFDRIPRGGESGRARQGKKKWRKRLRL